MRKHQTREEEEAQGGLLVKRNLTDSMLRTTRRIVLTPVRSPLLPPNFSTKDRGRFCVVALPSAASPYKRKSGAHPDTPFHTSTLSLDWWCPQVVIAPSEPFLHPPTSTSRPKLLSRLHPRHQTNLVLPSSAPWRHPCHRLSHSTRFDRTCILAAGRAPARGFRVGSRQTGDHQHS